MKIIYLKDQIGEKGGMERVTIAKANALAQIKGNEVWIIIDINREPKALPIDNKVHVICLDLDYSKEGKLWHVFRNIIKVRVFKQKLNYILNKIQPDIVIGLGGLENHFLFSMPYHNKFVFIRELHLISNSRRKKASNAFLYGLAFIRELLEYWTFRRYDCIVDVTQGDKEHHWKGDNRVKVIPNPIIQDYYHLSSLNQHVVITAGRLVMEKNYSSLIRSWGIVSKKHSDWKLEIWGDGIEKKELCQLIEANGLKESISINKYTDDILIQFSNASIFVLTSLMESFGMVITEAMSCGLPVVSYDCPYGPREIISEGKDGFLVSLGDELLLAERICYLIEHEDIRREMGIAAIEKSKQYSMDNIVKKWMSLFQELLKKKKSLESKS